MLNARDLDAVLPSQCRPQPNRQIAFGDAEGFALEIGEHVDAPAPARNDGVGRLVEQHEHRLDRRRIGFAAKADQFVDVGQREIAAAIGYARYRIPRAAGDVDADREALGPKQSAG